jgi:hypothetical protein
MSIQDAATKLLTELKADKVEWLAPYNGILINKSIMETNEHALYINEILKRHEEQQERQERQERQEEKKKETKDKKEKKDPKMTIRELSGLRVRFLHILRNKRCVLAYLRYRLQKIQDIYWETVSLPSACHSRMSPLEVEFFEKYSKLMTDYISHEEGFDISTDSACPPQSFFVNIRLSNEYKEPMSLFLDTHSIILHPGVQYYLRRSEVELLIRQGHLMIV